MCDRCLARADAALTAVTADKPLPDWIEIHSAIEANIARFALPDAEAEADARRRLWQLSPAYYRDELHLHAAFCEFGADYLTDPEQIGHVAQVFADVIMFRERTRRRVGSLPPGPADARFPLIFNN